MAASTVTRPSRLSQAVSQPQPRLPRMEAQWYSPPAVGKAEAIWAMPRATSKEKAAETVKALKALAPEIRYQLARAVKLLHVPELHFHYDESMDRGQRIDSLLRDLRTSDDSE